MRENAPKQVSTFGGEHQREKNRILNKLLGYFLEPKNGKYLEAVEVLPESLQDSACPIKSVSLMAQPKCKESVVVQVTFKQLKGTSDYHSLFLMRNESGEITTRIWLKKSDIKHRGEIHLIQTMDLDLIKYGSILIRFSNNHWPVCDYHQYEIPLSEYEVA